MNDRDEQDTDTQLAPPRKDAPASPQSEAGALPLDQVKLEIGEPIQLQLQSDHDHARHIVTLIGYLKGQSFIVTTPVVNGSMMLVREGQDFVVRLFSGKSAYAFTAVAKRVTNLPFPHIHLSYPKEVRGLVVRGSSRGRTNIICHATDERGRGLACVARDISIGGALLASRDQIGDVGSMISLKFRVKVLDIEHMLTLTCRIRSINASRPTADEAPTMLHGISFEELTSQDTLVISTLLYQIMVSEKEAES